MPFERRKESLEEPNEGLLDEETIQEQSFELRRRLEDLMERIRRFSLEEHVLESFEEDFCILVSVFSEQCLQRAVLLTDADVLERQQELVDKTQVVEENTTATLRLPIHLACDNNAPLSIIRALLEADVNNQSILKPDKWGDLPIHTACSRNNIEVIELLLEADVHKETLHVKDVHESLPLHMAARYNAPKQVIQLLLENDPKRETLFVEGIYGQFPLTVACRGNASADVIQALLDYDEEKRSVLSVDRTGRLPIHVYLLRNRDTQCIRVLLEGMIHGRILRVGLDNWKKEIQTMLAWMHNTYERDFATRDRLDMICEELERFMQRAVVFELATWKSSCLLSVLPHLNPYNCKPTNLPLKEIVVLAAKAPGNTMCIFDAQAFKKERRINSGAEIIIPAVLSFLEDESVSRVLEEFRNAGYLAAQATAEQSKMSN